MGLYASLPIPYFNEAHWCIDIVNVYALPVPGGDAFGELSGGALKLGLRLFYLAVFHMTPAS